VSRAAVPSRIDLAGERIAVYARYSSDRQNDTSIDDQLRELRLFVERHGGTFSDALVFTDRAKSGTGVAGREGFSGLMTAVAERRVDVVVIENTERLSRDLTDFAIAFRDLEELDVRLLTLDGLDSFKEDAAFDIGLRAVLGQRDIAKLRRYSTRGQTGRFDAGFVVSSVPYGYRIEEASRPVAASGSAPSSSSPRPPSCGASSPSTAAERATARSRPGSHGMRCRRRATVGRARAASRAGRTSRSATCSRSSSTWVGGSTTSRSGRSRARRVGART